MTDTRSNSGNGPMTILALTGLFGVFCSMVICVVVWTLGLREMSIAPTPATAAGQLFPDSTVQPTLTALASTQEVAPTQGLPMFTATPTPVGRPETGWFYLGKGSYKRAALSPDGMTLAVGSDIA